MYQPSQPDIKLTLSARKTAVRNGTEWQINRKESAKRHTKCGKVRFQNLMYCQLYDLPAERETTKKGRSHDPNLLYWPKRSSSTTSISPAQNASLPRGPALR